MNFGKNILKNLKRTIPLAISVFLVSLHPGRAVEPEAQAKKLLCHKYLAKIYVAQKDYPNALLEYQAWIALQPSEASVHYDYGALLTKSDKWSLATPQFKAAVKLAPGVPENHVGLGNCYMYAKNYDGAVAEYTKACSLGGKYQNLLSTALQYQAQEKSLKKFVQEKKQETKVQDDE